MTTSNTEQQEEKTLSPVEEASMKFTTLLPFIKKLGSAMPSQKGVVRVLHAFAEFPLGKEKPKLLNEAERQLFGILSEIQGLKSTIIQDIMKKNYELEQMKKTAVESVPPIAEMDVNNG